MTSPRRARPRARRQIAPQLRRAPQCPDYRRHHRWQSECAFSETPFKEFAYACFACDGNMQTSHLFFEIPHSGLNFFDGDRQAMTTRLSRLALLLGALTLSLIPALTRAQALDERLYKSMRWRMIGPFRGGRTVGATGVTGRPNVFY